MVYLSEGGPGIFPGGLRDLLRRGGAARAALSTLLAAFSLKLFWEQLSGPLMDTRLFEALTGHGWMTRLVFRLPSALPFLILLLLIYIWAPKLRLKLVQFDHTPLEPVSAVGSELKPLIYPWLAAVLIWAALDLTGHALVDRWSPLAPHPITGFFDEPYFRVHLFMLLAKYSCWYFGGAVLSCWIALLNRGGAPPALLLGYLPPLALWVWLEFLVPHTVIALPKQAVAQLSLINFRFDWTEAIQVLLLLSLLFLLLLAVLLLLEFKRRKSGPAQRIALIIPCIQVISLVLASYAGGIAYRHHTSSDLLQTETGETIEIPTSDLGAVGRVAGIRSREVPPLGPRPDGPGFRMLGRKSSFTGMNQLFLGDASGLRYDLGTYWAQDPWKSGWFSQDGSYSWIHIVMSGGNNPTPYLYTIGDSGSIPDYDLTSTGLQRADCSLIAAADETGCWLVTCDLDKWNPALRVLGQPESTVAPPHSFARLLESGEFKHRFTDFCLSAKPQNRRDRPSRLKFGADGELYAIDRNGCLWRIQKDGRLVRLSGGVLHRLLGNAPNKPPSVPAYGPWAGSRAAFAFGSEGEGRMFDPYNGVLYAVNPEGGLEPMYGFDVVIDPKKWTDSPYKLPGRLMLGGERGLTQWDLGDSPSSTLDDSGNYYVYLDRLLLFPPESP